jgi:NADH:ubiquinone reductase (H+-translocating)
VSHPDVYAVGDNALGLAPTCEPLRMSCATDLPTGTYVTDVVATTAGVASRSRWCAVR